MYSKPAAVLLNSILGVCLSYTVITLWFALTSDFVTDFSFVAGFLLYNIIWLASGTAYNKARYQKQGGGSSFWMSTILPPVLVIMILAGMLLIFF